MQKLEDIKISFETWCKQNHISVFYSDDSSSLPSIIYSDIKDRDLAEFKNIILKTKPPFIIIVGKDIKVEQGFYELYSDWVKENDKDYEKHLSLLEENVDSIVSLEIGFIHGGVFLYALESAEWHDDFDEISKIILTYDPDEIEENGLESSLPKIPKEEEDLFAKEIALSKEYGTASNIIQRNDIAERKGRVYFNKNGYEFDYYAERIFKDNVEDIFNDEVKPIRDEELKNQIKEFKAQGLKKVQIASKLSITTGTVNKFWEQI
jgi:hypothetical protein